MSYGAIAVPILDTVYSQNRALAHKKIPATRGALAGYQGFQRRIYREMNNRAYLGGRVVVTDTASGL